MVAPGGDVFFATIPELNARLMAKEFSAEDLARAFSERLQQLGPRYNALALVLSHEALRKAREVDKEIKRGRLRGPLQGIPYGVKDLLSFAGQPTTWGHVPRKTHVATTDALAVQRLKTAGAVVFGKSNVPLNLADFQSYNAVYGTSNNPWDLKRGPGGSSGGSAAMIAAGLSALEYGSDIGGSIRNPAAYCGVYGHKSTWCIVPKRGHSLAPKPVPRPTYRSSAHWRGAPPT